MPDKDKLTTIIIFGASGDLTWRKLVPALYNNYKKGRLAQVGEIVGFARRPYTDETFRSRLQEGVKIVQPRKLRPGRWDEFSSKLIYFQGNLDVAEDFTPPGRVPGSAGGRAHQPAVLSGNRARALHSGGQLPGSGWVGSAK